LTAAPEPRVVALEVAGLNAYYGKSQVVFDLDLVIEPGETVAILGRNGAGKTSTLLAIAGVVSSRATELRLTGREISTMAPFKRVRSGLFLVPSGSRVFPNLTVEENLGMVRAGRNRHRGRTLDDVYGVFPKLETLKDSRGSQLSGGERQMLAIGRAILARPAVMMLDEPSEGLAPMIVRGIGTMLQELNREGIAVLLTEQNYRLALDIATRTYFMEKGEIVWSGGSEEARNPEVLGRYLAVER
jgi:branched-chain amino acid transport system ATP-binding protein